MEKDTNTQCSLRLGVFLLKIERNRLSYASLTNSCFLRIIKLKV